MTEPLTLSFDVECAPRHAFDVWTNRFGQWWPRGHTVSGDPETIVLEPHVGGRIYERGPDGAEIDWGEITEWDPPGRLAYHWHIRRDRTEATNVELTFVDAGDGSTRVEIVHTAGSAWAPEPRNGAMPTPMAGADSSRTTSPTSTSTPVTTALGDQRDRRWPT